MKAKALRLPESLLIAVKFAEKREHLDEPTTLRKFLWLGAEKYLGDSYARGDVSLREASDALGLTTRATLELFWDMGIAGNMDADLSLKALTLVGEKAR